MFDGITPESVWDLDEDQFNFYAAAAHPESGGVGLAARLRSPVFLDEKGYKALQALVPPLLIEGEESTQWVIDQFKDKGLKGPNATTDR